MTVIVFNDIYAFSGAILKQLCRLEAKLDEGLKSLQTRLYQLTVSISSRPASGKLLMPPFKISNDEGYDELCHKLSHDTDFRDTLVSSMQYPLDNPHSHPKSDDACVVMYSLRQIFGELKRLIVPYILLNNNKLYLIRKHVFRDIKFEVTH